MIQVNNKINIKIIWYILKMIQTKQLHLFLLFFIGYNWLTQTLYYESEKHWMKNIDLITNTNGEIFVTMCFFIEADSNFWLRWFDRIVEMKTFFKFPCEQWLLLMRLELIVKSLFKLLFENNENHRFLYHFHFQHTFIVCLHMLWWVQL